MQQKALVVGLGASGEACTKFLLKRQWQVRATDTRSEPPALSRLSGTEGFSFVSLQEAQAQLNDCNLLVMSPGISPWHSAVTPLVRLAQSLGIVGILPRIDGVTDYADEENNIFYGTGNSVETVFLSIEKRGPDKRLSDYAKQFSWTSIYTRLGKIYDSL